MGYVLTPERTVVAVQDFRGWLTKNGLKAGIYVLAGLGALLIVRGVIELLTYFKPKRRTGPGNIAKLG